MALAAGRHMLRFNSTSGKTHLFIHQKQQSYQGSDRRTASQEGCSECVLFAMRYIIVVDVTARILCKRSSIFAFIASQ